MKICSNCNKEYEFFGQRVKLCRPCHRTYNREYHKNRSDEAKKKKQRKQKNRRKSIQKSVIEFLKRNPCIECGECRIPCLQFDHLVPENKVATVSFLVQNGASLDKIWAEINKCQVLCANCHSMKTAKQFSWYENPAS